VSPHGICFGKVVVSRSPSEGNFNWRQVIWHELAHVYHIQLSHSRVPRWFTEGLAEYETNVEDPAWVRHHDRELARALNAGTLRKVLELSEGFTHARSFEEILRSYHQSSLVIHFIAETWGFDALPRMLKTWGQFKTTTEVIEEVLEVTPDQFDSKFESWLADRYLNFKRQLTVDLASIPSADELEQKLKDDPDDGRMWAQLAIAHYRGGDVANADVAMTQATSHAGGDPRVHAIAALYYYERGRVKDAYHHGIAVLDAGADSYDLRFLLGSAALQTEDVESAEVHFLAATTLWNDGKEAWNGLARVARARNDEELAARAQAHLFMLDQNDPQIARQRVESARKSGDWSVALQAARRWVDINPTDSRAAEALIDAARQTGELDRAVDGWELLAVLRPSDSEDILLGAIEELARAGHADEAQRLARRARDNDVPASKIDAALGR
jgi:Flp pilus assembly protein TadD